MPARSTTDTTNGSAYMSVSAHVRQLDLSRGRFYELVAEGFFLLPIFLTANKRPAYTARMAERNLLAKNIGIGMNGEPRVFNRRHDGDQVERRRGRSNGRQRQSDGPLGHLVASLRSLGIEAVSEAQVAQAVAELFPEGIGDCDQGDVIRAVFRHLRRSGNA